MGIYSSISTFNKSYGEKAVNLAEIKSDQTRFRVNAFNAVKMYLKESSVNTDYNGLYGLKMYFSNHESLDDIKRYVKSLGLHPKFKEKIGTTQSGIVFLFNSVKELSTITVGLTTEVNRD